MWYDFWKDKYRKKFGPIVENYEKLHGLTESAVKKFIDNMTRPELDRLKQYWEETKVYGKRRVASILRRHAEELELNRADFVVFLFGGLGISGFSVVDGLKEKVVLVDLIKTWRDGKIKELDSVVLDYVKRFRKGEMYGS